MEIRDLQYLVSAAKAGSLSAASERLFISQQGLSSAIRRLEEELGYTLLTRSATGVSLTEQGQAFYDGAVPILTAFRAFVRNIAAPDGKPKISITCAYNILPKCPRPMQRLLLGQDPDYIVETAERFYSECEDMLERGECSFAIVYGPFDEARFGGRKLFSLEQCFIVNKKHPLAKEGSICIHQLRDVPLIIPHRHSRSNAIIRNICKEAGFEPHVALECDRPMEVTSLVRRNPDVVARMFVDDAKQMNDPDVAMLHLSDVDFKLDVCLLWKKLQPLTHIEREVWRAILDCVSLSESE